MERHDVTANLYRVGKYKSAMEPFSRDDMSAEDREAWQEILDPWWEAYTSGIETARDLSAGSINALMQKLPDEVKKVDGNLARLAIEKGLVDRLVTDTERRNYLIELAGENSEDMTYRHVTYKEYLKITQPNDKSTGKKIAVVSAVGDIIDGEAPAGTIGSKSLTKLIRKARLDDSVGAIVLPGIPVVASMGSLAASGGYWIAASADEIWASPTTLTGSIGIFGFVPTLEKTLARYGIFSDGVSTTPIAAGANLLTGISPEVGEVVQSVIEAGYEQFLTTVAEGRNMDRDAVHEIAQGRVWVGEKAKEIGLVDELGDLQQAIGAAAKLADLEDYSVWHVKPELSLEEEILRTFAEDASASIAKASNNPVSQLTKLMRKELNVLTRFNDPSHAYVICSNCPMLR